ncbi:hypothetical protein [Roseateles asaccharophilus]|uniref:Uncharacterized protein n=1 Tax=Roseateles asaccharophilus TaxID=582607 RepID=A0ABU2A1R7_9BURK|nr:hypothetical protein [Roseateles asaccharophilus]MDR7330965.1 hypothetical protein [Roseateles asaccharophilus]
MLAAFVRKHWRADGAAAAMLSDISTLTVWIPRPSAMSEFDALAVQAGPVVRRQDATSH